MAEVRRRKFSLEQLAQMLEILGERIGQAVSVKVEQMLRNSELAKKLGFTPAAETETANPVGQPEDALSPPQPAEVGKCCMIEGCQEPARARGLCSRHYQKQRYEEKRMTQPKRGSGTCSVENCSEKVYANEMCSRHFMEWVRSRRKD